MQLSVQEIHFMLLNVTVIATCIMVV